MSGMRGSAGKGNSTFSQVATIMFKNAEKAGAIPAGEGSSRTFARQLKNIHNQVRKRGGSIGNANLNMTGFLEEANAEPSPDKPPRKPGVTNARKVLPIDYPTFETSESLGRASAAFARKSRQPVETGKSPMSVPSLDIPSSQTHESRRTTLSSTTPSRLPLFSSSPQVQPKQTVPVPIATIKPLSGETLAIPVPGAANKQSPLPKSRLADRQTSAQERAKQQPRALVEEDHPLFDFRHTESPSPSGQVAAELTGSQGSAAGTSLETGVERTKPYESTTGAQRPTPTVSVPVTLQRSPAGGAEPAEKAAPSRRAGEGLRPHIVVPSLASLADQSKAQASEATQESTAEDDALGIRISVDLWEQQREREIQQLREAQEESEQIRLKRQLEEDHRLLGKEWVENHTRTSTPHTSSPGLKLAEKLYFSQTWEESLNVFESIVSNTSATQPLALQTVLLMEKKVKWMPPTASASVVERLRGLLKTIKGIPPDVIPRFEIRHLRGESAVKAIEALPAAVRERLDTREVIPVLPTYMAMGMWEEAMKLVETVNLRTQDPRRILETRMIAMSRLLKNPEAQTAVTDHYSRSLTNIGRLGREQKLALANTQPPMQRRGMLLEMTRSKNVDEEVYGALIKCALPDNVPTLVQESKKIGLNVNDPAIACAQGYQSIRAGDADAAFSVIERQGAVTDVLPTHVALAIAAARADPTPPTLRRVLAVVKRASPAKAAFYSRKILPLLHQSNMHSSIVELYDMYKGSVNFPAALPNATGFINEALISVGREPLSDAKAPVSTATGITTAGKAGRDDHREGEVAMESLASYVSSDTMLTYARDREWAKALEAVQKLPTRVPDDERATLTLLYNCALSAAVDAPDVTDQLYGLIKEREVDVNTTTTNTILSSFSKSENRWLQAIEIYSELPQSSRDASTYSVMLSLFGKRDLWEAAAAVAAEATSGSSKPPPVVFTLAINALHNHDWAVTLKLFQDMMKVHGVKNIKESLAARVLKSLENNGRVTEMQKLQKDLSKKKKK